MHRSIAIASLVFILASVGRAGDFDAPEHRQFDFWVGAWDVTLRTIQPDQTWKDSVKARASVYSVLDGKAILELWDSPTIKGFSLRHYDPATKQWVLYLNWPSNSRSNIGSLRGRFRHGRGVFEARWKQANGALGINRFTFSDIRENGLRWDDAYSRDGGKTWRQQWIMEFTRTSKVAPLPTATAPTYAHGGRCIGPAFDRLNTWAGHWKSADATMTVHRILDGCSVIVFLETKTSKAFALLTYNPQRKQVEQLWLDNRPNSPAVILRGAASTLTARSAQGTLRHTWKRTNDGLALEIARSTGGANWRVGSHMTFRRAPDAAGLSLENAINKVCPRSNRPIAADSLTRYRNKVVGFCNPGCRDDFAAHHEERPKDRAFFDAILDG